MTKKMISWNVNGLRACVKKGFEEAFKELDADIFCIQETKMQQGQLDIDFEGYHQYWNYAEKKGYSGTCIFTKEEPIDVFYGMDIPSNDTEGRLITLEFEKFYFVCCYTPNAQPELKRLGFRMKWEDDLREYLCSLKENKSVIYCGDLNVAHEEIDLKNPKTNRGNPGFSDEEREKFSCLLQSGFTDSFRYLYPNKTDAYSWWSYRFSAREKNIGWRIDYFVVSSDLKERIKGAEIHSEIFGSDHCPIELDIEI